MSATPPQSWTSLSPCRTYQYTRGMRWGPGPTLVLIRHAPGFGDELPPTFLRLTRDIYGGLMVLHLFAALRKAPQELVRLPDPVGPDNDGTLQSVVREALGTGGRVFAAWGSLYRAHRAPELVRERPRQVLQALAPLTDVWTFGSNSGGDPRDVHSLSPNPRAVLFQEKDLRGSALKKTR